MAAIIEIPVIQDKRGDLVVIEGQIGFDIKRVFYIYNVPEESVRGGHAHKTTKLALICLGGSCSVSVYGEGNVDHYDLNSPNKCLVLEPSDWHTMENFSDNSILLVLASTQYDSSDYITERF